MNKLKWLGTVILMTTAFLTAINFYPVNLMVGATATAILGYVSFKQKDKQYLMINGVFLFMNLFGVILWNYKL